MNDEERRRFREVAAECTPMMIRLAYLITGSQPAAERALRLALSTTARQWRVAQTAPERHILFTLCREQVSWRHRWTRVGPDDVSGAPDHDDDDSDGYGLHSAMRRAIRSLPRPERVVIVLQQYEDLTTTETAQVLGWSEDRVRHRTERARARLRDLLAELSAPDGSPQNSADHLPDPVPDPDDTIQPSHASREAST